MSQSNLIELSGVSKRYGRHCVLESVDLYVSEGDVSALVGENGAGKSTIIRIINGLARPSSGIVSLFGVTEARRLRNERSKIGFVSDESGAYQDLSAKDNLLVRCAEWGISTSEVSKCLRMVGLTDSGNSIVRHFSMGMKRRLDIATALLGDCPLIIMDEPINGLDPSGIAEIRHIIQRLHTEEGKTILISSHNLDELEKVASAYTFISHGRVAKAISQRQLKLQRSMGVAFYVDNPAKAQRIIVQKDPAALCKQVAMDQLMVTGAVVGTDLLISELVFQGVSVSAVCPQMQSLESFYLNLIEGREADAQAAA